MNVLVVGGAGYVGSVLVRELLGHGHKVRVLDRLYFGDVGIRDIAHKIELVRGDMRTFDASVLDDIEAVVNVGGLSNDPTAEYNEQANWQMNAYATAELAEACVNFGVRRFIFASSASVYDTGIIDSEADDIIQDEETPVNPTRPYSASKRYAEEQLLKVAGNELCPVILRKGTIFGWSPRMRYDLVINTMVKSALSTGVINVHAGGEMWRPLVSIKDVARAYLAVLEAPVEKVNGQIFNVSRRNYRISELALWLKVVLNGMGVNVTVHTTYTQTGVRSYRISNRKLRETLGFEYRHDIEHEVREIVQRAREDGYGDFGSPRYYNIDWMKLLEEAHEIISITGSVFDG